MHPQDAQEWKSWVVDYCPFIEETKGAPYKAVADYYLEQFPYEWRESYLANTTFPADVAIVQEGSLFYQFHWHTETSSAGVQKDARLMAAYGRSAPSKKAR